MDKDKDKDILDKMENEKGVNENSLPDSLDGLVDDIRDELESYQQESSMKEVKGNTQEVSKQVAELERMLREVDLDSLPNPQDIDRFIVGKTALNVQQIDIIISDLFQAMLKNTTNPNNNTLRTLAELVRTKNETLTLLSEYIVNKDKLSIERIKANLMGNINSDLNGNGNSIIVDDSNRVATQTINQMIEQRIDQEIQKKNENLVDLVEQAVRVEKLDSNTLPNPTHTKESKKQEMSLDDLE